MDPHEAESTRARAIVGQRRRRIGDGRCPAGNRDRVVRWGWPRALDDDLAGSPAAAEVGR